MSKIQKALGKIQGTKGAPDDTETLPVLDEQIIVAKVVNSGIAGESYDVSEKCLHVDGDALREAGLLAPESDEQMLENQYRDIKRPLIAHAFGKRATKVERGNLIMVTSALAGEGKTFTSLNLVLSMARERDHSVILVDADVAKPHTSEMFGAENEPGLLDVLDNPSIPIRSLIIPTDVNNLSLLPAGRPRGNATELLASNAMEDVCRVLSTLSAGQIVVMDSPPILQTSEAKVLAGLAGQIVIVVRAEETSRDAVLGALAMLDPNKAINLVLNQVRVGHGDKNYGYGYGYGGESPVKEEGRKNNSGLWD